jgi:hypothetical protein
MKVLSRRAILGLFGVIAVAFLVMVTWHSREPVYQGRRLSQWLEGTFQWDGSAYSEKMEDSAAKEAVLHMGTNAIPTLLRLMSKKDYPLTVSLRKHGIGFNYKPLADIGFFHPFIQRTRGLAGFQMLQTRGIVGVPALLDVENHTPAASLQVFMALSRMGDGAIHPLTMILTNSDPQLRILATYHLSGFRKSASEITPFLTQNLSHSNASLRAFTAGVLGSFGSPASNSVPALLEACRDGQTGVSEAAQDALKKIDPIAATKAGIK